MDFKFTAEQERFRQEVRTFLDRELPPDWVGYVGGTAGDHVVDSSHGWQVFQDMAGSDLASLQTKAVKDGNNFIINGQKTRLNTERPGIPRVKETQPPQSYYPYYGP